MSVHKHRQVGITNLLTSETMERVISTYRDIVRRGGVRYDYDDHVDMDDSDTRTTTEKVRDYMWRDRR